MARAQFSSFSGQFLVSEHVPSFPLGVEKTVLLNDSRCCRSVLFCASCNEVQRF